MRRLLTQFRDWCNLNVGVFTFLAFLVTLVAYLPFSEIELAATYPFFQAIARIFTYQLQIPLYIIVLLSIIAVIYFIKIKRRYRVIPMATSILKGKWRNDWTTPEGKHGHEIATITANLEYRFDDGRHFFNIEEIKINQEQRQIEFLKVAVQQDDKRRLLNKLRIENNDLLIGTENDHKIKYTRVEN